MDIFGYSAHVLVNGRKVKEYRHNGLTYIEAKEGTEFSIEVKNHAGQRVLAVVSIDGLDIIEGKPATVDSRGYIVSPYNADTFTGWRKSDTEVGAFQFTQKEKSYATEKGGGQNNGIIAIKLFAEKYTAPVYRHLGGMLGSPAYKSPDFTGCMPMTRGRVTYSTNSVFTGPDAGSTVVASSCHDSLGGSKGVSFSEETQAVADFDMGTTWGSKKEDKVKTVEFERGQELTTFEFYYASREALLALGIPLVNQRAISLPQGFANSYAQPPKNWK